MVKKTAITETTFKIQLPAGCHGYTYTLYLEHECENAQNCNGIFVPGKEKKHMKQNYLLTTRLNTMHDMYLQTHLLNIKFYINQHCYSLLIFSSYRHQVMFNLQRSYCICFYRLGF